MPVPLVLALMPLLPDALDDSPFTIVVRIAVVYRLKILVFGDGVTEDATVPARLLEKIGARLFGAIKAIDDTSTWAESISYL